MLLPKRLIWIIVATAVAFFAVGVIAWAEPTGPVDNTLGGSSDVGALNRSAQERSDPQGMPLYTASLPVDDFNRPDGPLGPNWAVQASEFNIVNNAARGGTPASQRAIATYTGGLGSVVEGDVAINGASVDYTGFVLDYGAGVNNLFIKVQDNLGSGYFNTAACYLGNNASSFGLGFFTLQATFQRAHMKVSVDAGRTVTIQFSNIDGGASIQTYVCTGAPSPEGAGIGIVGYQGTSASMDNFTAMVGGAGGVGLVADNSGHAIVFDADADVVMGSVRILGDTIGDCAITDDSKLGFVTDFTNQLWVVDLATSPPSLAAGTNPIPISNAGEDIALSPDGKYLVVSDGSAVQPLSVVDIASRAEIGTFNLGSDANSVDVCSDGSVLVTSVLTGAVRRLMIGAAGNLTDTGEVMDSGASGSSSGPNNVFCAPGGKSGVVILRNTGYIRSFTIPGLTPMDDRDLTGGYGIAGQVHPAGDRVFTRSNDDGYVDVFGYNATTGALGTTPGLSFPIAGANTYFGMDQMALHPNGDKLYVPQPNAVKVFDPGTGALLGSITDQNISEPTGICFPRVAAAGFQAFGYVFADMNSDGVRNPNEQAGMQVPLTLKQGATTIATVLSTGPSGWFDFGLLPPGHYCAEAAIPPEYVFTSPHPACFTLDQDRVLYFGVRLGKATIGDFVWYDTNGNGVQDAGEAGIPDVTLALAPNTGGAPGATVQTATTGADGKYVFTDVLPGSYFVQVTDAHVVLVGLTLTAGPQSKPNPAGPITVADGGAYLDADFGYTFACAESRGVISGRVWRDANADGKLDPGEPGIPAVQVCATPMGHLKPFCTNTTPAGIYRLCVPPLTYLVAPDKSPASVLNGLAPTTPEFVLPAVIRPGARLEVHFGCK